MPSGPTWLRTLPALVTECLRRWELGVDGPTRFGQCAVVLPVLRADGSPAALKVGWPHEEATHEHLALRAWGGAGAVRLLAADPSRWALLLERLDPDCDLDVIDIDGSCREIGLLIRRLDRPALPALDRLSAYLRRLAADLEVETARDPAKGGQGGLPRRLVERGRAIAADLASRPDIDARLVHTDLHGQNVLSRPATRELVAIDPKPMAGLPEFAVAPALWNRWPEVVGSGDPRAHLNRRVDTLCEHAGLDPDVARC